MRNCKLLIVLIIVLGVMMMFGCGSENNPTATSTPSANEPTPEASPTIAPTEEPLTDGYKVTVVDETGKGLENVFVQLCKDTCVPSKTDSKGVATFNLPEDEYKVAILQMPEGYTYSGDETEFYFESGSKEMTIVLKAAE